MQGIGKKIVSLVLAGSIIFSANPVVFATETQAVVEESGDNVVITEEDKPYLGLGADLSAEQQHTVLTLMGIDVADLDKYDVVYVNNAEEHQYLDEYISSSEIGTRSLSSVVITKTNKGDGLSISTYNINYCTVGMYKNALATAGINDANIIVAGPFELSGTCALVGILKAYEEMTGESLDDDIVDAAMDELVTTGILNESVDADPEEVEALIADLKEQIAKGALKSENSIRKAIDKTASKYGVVLNDEEKEQIINLLLKLKGLNLDWNSIADQAAQWAGVFENSESAGIFAKVSEFFKQIADIFKSLFS